MYPYDKGRTVYEVHNKYICGKGVFRTHTKKENASRIWNRKIKSSEWIALRREHGAHDASV